MLSLDDSGITPAAVQETNDLHLDINLFGPVQARIDERPIALRGSKTRALLAYLAFTPGIKHKREDLAQLLWPDTTEERARQSLRSSLYQLRKALDEAAGQAVSDQLVVTTPQDVTLDRDANVRCDVARFTGAIAAIESHQHTALVGCEECIAKLATTAHLYRGEFLAGVAIDGSASYEDWLLLHRESLNRQALEVINQLVELYVEMGDNDAAHDWAFQVLQLDRYQESAHRVIMSSLAALGHTDQALAHFHSWQELMHEELGIGLASETCDLATGLQQSLAETTTDTESTSAAAPPTISRSARATEGGRFNADSAPSIPQRLAAESYLPFHRNQTFVGRTHEVEAIQQAFASYDSERRETPAVALTGIGGIGKTQLAVAYAYAYGGLYPGGVQWIDFSDAENIAGEIAWVGTEAGLGLFGAGDGLPLQEQAARVTQHWQSGQAQLLVFDNCEDTELARKWLPTQGPAHVLLTSRRGDWPPELPVRQIPVTPLHRDASVDFLLNAATRLSWDEADIVAAEVGDHPLALHLAGRLLARLRTLSGTDYVALLREPATGMGEVPTTATAGYSPTAHDLSIERTFARSYEQLDSREPLARSARELLARIVCMAPGNPINRMFLIESVAPSANASDVLAADNALQRLVDLGLVTQDPNRRVVMHRLTVRFITGVLDNDLIENGRTSIEERICREIPSDRFAAPNEVFESPLERSHLISICNSALERLSPDAATLALAVGRKLRLEWETGRSIEILEAGLRVAEARQDLHDQGRLLVELMKSQASHGIYALTDLAQRACDAFESADPVDLLWVGVAHDRLATSQWYSGEGEQAYITALHAEELLRHCDNAVIHARSLRVLAAIEAEVRFSYQEAIDHLDQALAMLDPLDDATAFAPTLAYKARVLASQGHYSEALEHYRQAGDAVQAAPSSRLLQHVFFMYTATMSLELGEPETARNILTDHVEQELGGSPRLCCIYYTLLARIQVQTGEIEQALASLHRAATFEEDTEDPAATGEIWRVVGLAASRRNRAVAFPMSNSRPVGAALAFERSLEHYERAGLRSQEKANVLLNWARHERDRGQPDSARTKAERAIELFRSIGAPAHLDHNEDLLASLAIED